MGQNETSAGFRLNPDRDERHSINEEPFMSRIIPTKNRLLAFNKQQGRCY